MEIGDFIQAMGGAGTKVKRAIPQNREMKKKKRKFSFFSSCIVDQF